jgi:hypothetical protein
MTKTSAPVPSRQLRKAIFRPSGDQAACPSGTAFRVSRRSPLPSALITKISSLQAPGRSHSPALPRSWIAKTSFRPSGDQAGTARKRPPFAKRLRASLRFPLPSAFMT